MSNVVPLHALVKRPHARGRGRGLSAPRVTSVHRVSQATVRTWREEEYPENVEPPVLRGDCLEGGGNQQRPCPWVSCRYHLALDVTRTDGVLENFPGVELDDMPDTCALDVADRGGVTLEEVAIRLNVSRERIRQIESTALRKKKAALLAIAREHDIDLGPARMAAPDVPEVVELPTLQAPSRAEQLAAARAAGAARGSLGMLHLERKPKRSKREAVLEAEQFGKHSRVPDDVPRITSVAGYEALAGRGDPFTPFVEAALQRPNPPITVMRVGESNPEPAHAAQAPVEVAEERGEPMARKANCSVCKNDFKVDTDTGKLPGTCPDCKAKNGGAKRATKPRPAREPSQARVVLDGPPSKSAPAFVVNIGHLRIECQDTAALEHVVSRWGKVS